jgi:DNA-binding transcriptional ArsR family regulator
MGILRIHFTSDDLARTTLATTADPLWEILLSRFRFHERHAPLAFRPWVHQVRNDPDRLARMRPGARLLAVLAPLGPYFPDFLTPPAGSQGLEAGLDTLTSTPRARLRRELCRLAQHSPVPGWVRSLAEGDAVVLTRLGTALLHYHQAAIAPHHDLIQACIDADRARRAHVFLANGVDGLLASMPSLMRWRPPVLEVNYDVNQELHLRGRGLRLVPSYFCHRSPVSLADPDLTPILIYPIDQDLRWPQTAITGRRRLEALFGRTRTAVLHTIDLGTTTTQLARLLRISPASVSRHTTVLRDAGLITTHRHGTAVLHTLTPLGIQLLEHQQVGTENPP